MLKIAERARDLLVQMTDDAFATAELATRIRLTQKGFSIHLDKAASDDETFSYKGRVILVLDAEASRVLATRTLDVRESDDGAVLALR